MKLNDLLARASVNFDPDEWECVLGRPGVAGGVAMTFVDGEYNPVFSTYWLKFTYTAPVEMEFNGMRVTRTWIDGGMRRVKIVRDDNWGNPITFKVGDQIAVEPLIWPDDLA